MPYVTITASKGFSTEQKKQLLQKSTDAVVQAIAAPLANVKVMLHELGDGHFVDGGNFDATALMFVVELIEGRTDEGKAALVKALSVAGFETTGVPESSIRVRVIDFPRTNMGMAGGMTAQQAGR